VQETSLFGCPIQKHLFLHIIYHNEFHLENKNAAINKSEWSLTTKLRPSFLAIDLNNLDETVDAMK